MEYSWEYVDRYGNVADLLASLKRSDLKKLKKILGVRGKDFDCLYEREGDILDAYIEMITPPPPSKVGYIYIYDNPDGGLDEGFKIIKVEPIKTK